jgi:hypothetical protein
MKHAAQWIVILGLSLLAEGAALAIEPPSEDAIVGPPKGPWRRLFLDAMVVEQQQGLLRVFHAAEKHQTNPVLRKDKEWEGKGPYLYGTVMWDNGRLRMWYHHFYGSQYWNSYAESTDGIAWTKPNLGIVSFKGSKDNNIFLTVTEGPAEPRTVRRQSQCHNPSVIKQPWERDPAKRYVLYGFSYDYLKPRAAFSPDGLHWTFVPKTAEKGLFSTADVVNFFHDPYKNRYAATWKSSNRRGRAVGVATSTDGLTWTKQVEGPVFVADDLDPDATQIYGMPVFPYQGMYIGLPWIYNARWFKYGTYADRRLAESEKDSPCTMDVQLAWSWDLVNWTRLAARACFIPRGDEGRFDSGMIYTARAPVQVGDNLYFYYGGMDGPHNAKKWSSAIGLAVLRLDGFCSMHAGDTEGSLVTRREPMRVPRVTINAKTAAHGYVLAELLDTQNCVIPGFSREECAPFKGDSVRHVLAWRTATLPVKQLEADTKIRFVLKNADLYSYLPEQPSP